MKNRVKKFFSRGLFLAREQRGATAILLSILIMSVLLVIVLGTSALMLNQIKTMRDTIYSVEAFYAADAGAEICLYQTRKETGNCQSAGGSISDTLDNGATYTADRTTDTSIEAVGNYAITTRKVELSW